MDDVARVVLALDAPDVAEEVLDFLDRSGRARVVATASDGRQLQEAVRQLEPHAVVADPSLVPDGVPSGALLALAVRESVLALRTALDAGAKGFFVWPGEREALVDAVASTAAARGAPEKRARVVAVRASRGSAGCTFVATHLAQALAKRGSSVLLIDLDPVRADVTAALGLAGGEHRSLADLTPVASELSASHLDRVAVEHASGFGALLAPPVDALDQMSSAFLSRVIQTAASSADAVVLHLARDVDEHSRACIASVDRLLEVMTLDVFALRASSRTLQAISPLRPDGYVDLVVNRAGAGSDITPRDVGRAFPGAPVHLIPSDGAVARLQDRGRLLPLKGRVGRALDRLAADVASEAQEGAGG
jgi:Flp pilus assembly CpaE family ATPase